VFFAFLTCVLSSVTTVPSIGSQAPKFESTALVGGSFKTIKLEDYVGKWLVLFFYPLDFTFVCPTEIVAFSDAAVKFREINAEVVGASVDSHFSHLAWTQQERCKGGIGKIDIPLIADLDKSLSRDYGALLGSTGHTLRATYIIDNKGIVRHLSFNDAPVGRNVEEYLRLVQAFQHSDAHGEVCPASWTPGKATIIPTPEEKLTFFEKNG